MASEPNLTSERSVQFIVRSDLDKTYLRTEFDTFGDLVKTAFERPDRKRSVPGAASLLRELGRSEARVHVLSGSPRQMRGRIQEKLLIDGVRCDELTLKPNLKNLITMRFRAVRDQLGYKLPALLSARLRDQYRGTSARPPPEVLLGDDVEADAFVYSLYADVCEGRVTTRELDKVLASGHVYRDARASCREILPSIVKGPTVERMLIHLDRQTPPSRFSDYGRRVVPFYNYLQAAFVLAEDDRLSPRAVLRIATEFLRQHRFDSDSLARSYGDLLRRGHVTGALAEKLEAALHQFESPALEQLSSMATSMLRASRQLVVDGPASSTTPPVQLDYVALAKQHRGGRNRRRLPRLQR